MSLSALVFSYDKSLKRLALLFSALIALSFLLSGKATAQTFVNTPFIIADNQTTYAPDQIWVTFAGTFTNTGAPQFLGDTQLTPDQLSSTWLSVPLTALLATPDAGGTYNNGVLVPGSNDPLPFFNGTEQYTFSLNGFSGRVYVNYGNAALTAAPDPGNPGTSPYIVFEPTVTGSTLSSTTPDVPPPPSSSNMDLSYVDGVSAPAQTNVRDGTTGASLPATSNNPVTTNANILANVAALVPSGADVYDSNNNLVRVMSSAAAPNAYHTWTSLINTLTTAGTTLNIDSYTSATLTGAPPTLNNALFGFSGGGTATSNPANFNVAQSYTTTAKFVSSAGASTLTSQQIAALNAADPSITSATPGVVITGSGTQAGSFQIFITQAALTAGTGIYGNNPGYYVLEGNTVYSYAASGIQNDLSGRIVGDLTAGIVFGWSNSTVNIANWAAQTGTNLYGATFSSATVGGLSTGEYFYLISLAAAQGKLSDWIGSNADSNPEDYDAYLAAVSANTQAYASGFTDRLEGPGAPGTFWYTANAPADPNSPTAPPANLQNIGFVEFDLGGTSAVPEPSTYVLVGLGCIGLLLYSRRSFP